MEEAIRIAQAAPADHPNRIATLFNRGRCLSETGRLPESLASYREALEGLRRHPHGSTALVKTLNRVGLHLFDLGRAEDALPYQEKALALSRRLDPEGHERNVTVLRNSRSRSGGV